jgi:phosphoribosylglycinamide formyltransferase 1
MAAKKLHLAVFISGRGSNLQSLIDACKDPSFPAQISVVISNRPGVQGLERAEKAGIPALAIDHKFYGDREGFEAALLDALKTHKVDVVCLAGFMRILTPYFIGQWEDRIINIHPSLLPDYKGTHTHERVLQDGKKETGCTVHYVVPEMDSGPIIVQKRVAVKTGDTPEILAARVLEQEHVAYPEAVRIVAKTLLK